MENFIKTWETWASIINNTLGAIILICGIIGGILYFGGKKYKILELKSKTFNINLEINDFKKAMFPISSYEEIETIEYDGNLNQIDFIQSILPQLQNIKDKYQHIAIFGITEMFIPFVIGFFMQNTKHITAFRKLKEQNINFLGNPWSYPSFFSLKWILGIKNYFKYGLKILNNKEKPFNLGDEINLIIPISFGINENNIPDNLKKNKLYRYGLEETNGNFLINKGQLKKFEKNINNIISKINNEIGTHGKIHIFATLPIPFCVALGQAIHRNNCECIFYDFNKDTSTYSKIISTKDILNLQNLGNMKKN